MACTLVHQAHKTGSETFPALVTQILNDEALTSSSGNKNGLLDSMTDVRK